MKNVATVEVTIKWLGQFFFLWRSKPNRAQAASLFTCPHHARAHTHARTRARTHTHTRQDSSVQLPTKETQETKIHALCGIRTRDPRNRVAADESLRPHSHRYRQFVTTIKPHLLPPHIVVCVYTLTEAQSNLLLRKRYYCNQSPAPFGAVKQSRVQAPAHSAVSPCNTIYITIIQSDRQTERQLATHKLHLMPSVSS